ncbi:transcriptional repressor TCF25-domain-containing protein [Limtongia smithiae]|uniref:transcriptional repressor TCF25-domain-containing protein n=1 Tax=Limtongia smithiae TaxID=1125753 RepID=UPI0034CD51CE
MSLRAARRAEMLAARERERMSSPLAAATEDNDDGAHKEENSGDEGDIVLTKPKINLYALLNNNDEVAANSSEEDSGGERETPIVNKPVEAVTTKSAPASRPAKKKKSKKGKKNKVEQTEKPPDDTGLDDIDKALAELNLKNAQNEPDSTPCTVTSNIDTLAVAEAVADARLLSVDTRNLDPEREMRRLFGRRVMQEEGRAARRAGHHARMAASSKRYVLVQPGEDWPRSHGFLGMTMEVLATEGEITSFKFTHSRSYMDIQQQFYLALQFDDAELINSLYHKFPYHASSLLQISEILAHTGEHTRAASALERALFVYNKAFHSMFNISTGRVRLPFQYYENRGFYLAIYRYVRVLERKGIWSSAFEFLKIILEVSAEDDPYIILIMIDLYALRSGNDQFLIDTADSHIFKERAQNYLNIAFSLALAHLRLKNAEAAEAALERAADNFPWALSALALEIGLDVPPQLMKFNEPPSTYQHILTALYVSRSSSLWTTPEAKTLLQKAVENVKVKQPVPSASILYSPKEISLDLFRHVIMSDIKPALELLPRGGISDQQMWSDDILPPADNVSPYLHTEISRSPQSVAGRMQDGIPTDDRGVLNGLWNSLMQWRRRRREEGLVNGEEGEEEAFEEADAEIAWALANEALEAERAQDTVAIGSGEEQVQQDGGADAAPARESYISSLFRVLAGGFRGEDATGAANRPGAQENETEVDDEEFVDAMEFYDDDENTDTTAEDA